MKNFFLALAFLLLAGCAATPAAPAAPAPQELTTCEFVARWSDWFQIASTGSADALNDIYRDSTLDSHIAVLQSAVAEVEAIQVESTGALLRRDTINALKHAIILFEWLRDDGESVAIRPAFQDDFAQYTDDLRVLQESAAALYGFCAATE